MLRNIFLKKVLTNNFQHRFSSSISFKCLDLSVERTHKTPTKPDEENLVFGHHFSDHMLAVEWSAKNGWGKPAITPVCNLSIHPAAKCLHYAVELFEGMKAYRCVDGKIRLFRPDLNMQRMNNSALRACLPTFDGNELIECIKKLIGIDEDFVPSTDRSSLYIRPTMIGTEGTLGVSSSNSCLLYVLTGPVGPYFPTGFKPVSLLADPQYVRAWPGGTGSAKMGSNYAPTIFVANRANSENLQQVLWLFGEDHQLTEVGTMNIFMYWTNEDGEKELVTPPLDQGIILPGITRQSLLDLACSWNEFKVTEKRIPMSTILKGLEENRIYELFGTGTACVVCPIASIRYLGTDYLIPTMTSGAELTNRFLKSLTDIQYGRAKSDWMVEI